jgi:hypothetical protein
MSEVTTEQLTDDDLSNIVVIFLEYLRDGIHLTPDGRVRLVLVLEEYKRRHIKSNNILGSSR